MAVDQDRKLAQLQTQEGDILRRLRASPTAASGRHAPALEDIAAQQRLLQTRAQIESIRDKRLKERWYGDPEDRETRPVGGEAGFVGKTLDILARPLYGVVGAVDYATGQSTERTLSGAVRQNIGESKRTFSDVLRGAGVPGVVSAPLGFAMDIAFDPITWGTLGTAALVPRVATGLVKGGVRGAAKGAQSRALEAVVTARNFSRAFTGSGKKAAQKAPEELGRFGRLSRRLDEAALRTADEYDAMIGKDVAGDVATAGKIPIPGLDSQYRMRLGDMVREAASRVPFMQQYFKYFDYNNAEWTRLARIKDTLMRVLGTDENMRMGAKAFVLARERGIAYDDAWAIAVKESGMLERHARVTPSPPIDQAWGDVDKVPKVGAAEFDKTLSRVLADAEKPMRDAADAVDIMKDPRKFVSSDAVENAMRIAAEDTRHHVSIDDLKDIIGRGELGETGAKWFDDMRGDIAEMRRGIRVGKRGSRMERVMSKVIDGYQAYLSFFKRGKVGASPTAWTNAVIGNPTMAWMAGLNIFDPKYMGRIKDASSVVYGMRGSDLLLLEFLQQATILQSMDVNPSLFSSVSGMSPRYAQAKALIERVVRTGSDEGLISETTNMGELGKALGVAIDEIAEAMETVTGGTRGGKEALAAMASSIKKIPTPKSGQILGKLVREGRRLPANAPGTGMVANEFFDSTMANQAFEHIRKRAAEGNHVYKLLNFSFNKASEAYEGIDQSFKLGTVMYATMDGLTARELAVVSRMMDIQPEHLTKVKSDGVWRWQLDGTKAFEFANEVYLNYSAMPAAIRVLRSLPLVGSPFASFTYGMMLKTGKALAYNPSVFNKVTFAFNDFSGGKSPLERGVLSDPRYAYLNEPGMMKLSGLASSPFFQKYAIYMNMANAVPYYSFNMFTPSERRYDELLPKTVVGMIDKSPFVKEPIGSTIFDNLILPMIIGEARPLGVFGQPLYPTDATVGERFGYGLRSLADPMIPGFWSPVGGLVQGALAPGITEFAPSYRWRQIAHAMRGRTSLGTTSREPAASRTTRALLGSIGLPVQSPLPLSYLPRGLEEQVKKASRK